MAHLMSGVPTCAREYSWSVCVLILNLLSIERRGIFAGRMPDPFISFLDILCRGIPMCVRERKVVKNVCGNTEFVEH